MSALIEEQTGRERITAPLLHEKQGKDILHGNGDGSPA